MDDGSQELKKGYQITLDALSEMSEKLRDKNYIDQVICEAIKQIGMKLIDGPHSISYNDCIAEESGITSTAILAESAVTIHTYPNTGYFALDVFSCKPFDAASLLAFFQKHFHINRYHMNRIVRGSQVIEIKAGN
jgi:S-adenosylmethionine decarboxylase